MNAASYLTDALLGMGGWNSIHTAAAICGILVGMEKAGFILYGVAGYDEIRKANGSLRRDSAS